VGSLADIESVRDVAEQLSKLNQRKFEVWFVKDRWYISFLLEDSESRSAVFEDQQMEF
jgi:hypothetical protein